MDRHLDPHCEAILQEYRDALPQCKTVAKEVYNTLKSTFEQAGLLVAAIEYRVKAEESLAGKLELKGGKYKSLADITDIIGLRVITFYTDDVDKVASAVERLFTVDWDNSVDKRPSSSGTSPRTPASTRPCWATVSAPWRAPSSAAAPTPPTVNPSAA